MSFTFQFEAIRFVKAADFAVAEARTEQAGKLAVTATNLRHSFPQRG
jgi:hypothetical protein